MANIYLELDLKSRVLKDDEGLLYYRFNNWDYDLANSIFELDDLTISYDLISTFEFEREVKQDEAYVELEENMAVDIDIYNSRLEDYITPDLNLKIDRFVADKNLPDGDYKVKYNYYFDFSDNNYVCEVLEVIASE